jgi:hypothetical protein
LLFRAVALRTVSFRFCVYLVAVPRAVAASYQGGPNDARTCTLDIDGDNRVQATTDALIYTRISLGMSGPTVLTGITFASHATRSTWPAIRDYLVTQCGMAVAP